MDRGGTVGGRVGKDRDGEGRVGGGMIGGVMVGGGMAGGGIERIGGETRAERGSSFSAPGSLIISIPPSDDPLWRKHSSGMLMSVATAVSGQ